MVRITEKIHNEMVEMRKNGSTYSDIMNKLNVSKWTCMNHLKGIKPEENWTRKEWQKAEIEARKVLESMGFNHILDLNEVCNVAPFWDYYAELEGGEQWLIDVTTNTQKSLAEKQSRGVKGFKLGILYRDLSEWRLIRIASEVISTKKVNS